MAGSVSIQCPKCKAKLKLKNPKAVGKKVPCPKCKQPFVIKPLPEPEDDDDFLSNFDSFDEDYAAPDEDYALNRNGEAEWKSMPLSHQEYLT